MFLENESELCECGLTSFRRIRLRQLVWSFTPIAIFYENFLSVKYRRFSRSCKEFSPKSEKKKKTLNRPVSKMVLFLRNPRELGFSCDCII